jgi:protein-S-isoprenylcysteine O-methyltransferase Ste14
LNIKKLKVFNELTLACIFSFFVGTLGFFIAFLAMCLAYYVRINIEERELIGKFQDQYLQYKKTTKMIIPYVW